jgi:long-subunit fatty acid transport protein
MRVTPSLSFRVDRSFEAGARIDAALARLGLGGEAPTAATQVADEGDDDDV